MSPACNFLSKLARQACIHILGSLRELTAVVHRNHAVRLLLMEQKADPSDKCVLMKINPVYKTLGLLPFVYGLILTVDLS